MDLYRKQPAPIYQENQPASVWFDVVLRWWFPAGLVNIALHRSGQGVEKYGVGLQPFNGRNAFQDAVEENLDHIAYVEQLRQEENLPGWMATMLQVLDLFSIWVLVKMEQRRA